MSRIALVDQKHASAEQKALLDAVQVRYGAMPNYLRVLANSPAAIKSFLGLHGVAPIGSLSARTRQRIALTGDATTANRAGSSKDAKDAAVKLARSQSAHRGAISNAELFEAREAGHAGADIVEIITRVGVNLTAMIGKTNHVEIDFRKVDLEGA